MNLAMNRKQKRRSLRQGHCERALRKRPEVRGTGDNITGPEWGLGGRGYAFQLSARQDCRGRNAGAPHRVWSCSLPVATWQSRNSAAGLCGTSVVAPGLLPVDPAFCSSRLGSWALDRLGDGGGIRFLCVDHRRRACDPIATAGGRSFASGYGACGSAGLRRRLDGCSNCPTHLAAGGAISGYSLPAARQRNSRCKRPGCCPGPVAFSAATGAMPSRCSFLARGRDGLGYCRSNDNRLS